jgi:hypothetical protein
MIQWDNHKDNVGSKSKIGFLPEFEISKFIDYNVRLIVSHLAPRIESFDLISSQQVSRVSTHLQVIYTDG